MVLSKTFLGLCVDRRRNFERKHSGCWYWRIRNVGRITKIIPEKLNQKKSQQSTKMEILYFLWFSKIIRKRFRIQGRDSETRTHHKERESQRRISNKRWHGNSRRLLVYSRRLYLPSSCWKESSIIRALRRVIPYSTEIHWCHQVNSHRFGCSTRKTNWQIRGQVSGDSHYWTKLIQKDLCGSAKLTKIQTTARPDHICWKSRS